ncbi:MAG: VCBS domain-containing protein, partial [Hyphomicrobiales bacterium]|nr:VCBS domain-containing protein [Hyphomicrobiales bacterium]
MAKLATVTFSNSKAATADQYTIQDSQIELAQTLNLLSQGDPGSATLYSIGANNISGGANMTRLPSGTSGNVLVPTDLTAKDSVGYQITTTQGATVTFLNGNLGTVSYSAGAALQSKVDNLQAGQSLTDSFLYAIQLANGTVSWNTVTVQLVGQAANLAVSDQGVMEDAYGGVTVHNTLTDNVKVDAFAASGAATGFTIAATAGNWGALNAASGNGEVNFTYSVTDDYIYGHSAAGYGEIAHTDTFTVKTTNFTTETFSETIYGNIHAAVYTGDTSVNVDEGGAVALNISAVDHDDNANLTYTISGLSAGQYLTDAADGATQLSGSTVNLTAAELSGLTFHAGEEGTSTLQLTITNTETDSSDNTTATATTTQNIAVAVNDAPLTPGAGASLSAVEGASTGIVTVGAFTDGAPGDNAGDFTAAIDWGDGTTSAGTVTYNGGVYSVSSA